VRFAAALIAVVLASRVVWAWNDGDLVDVTRFCATIADADGTALDRAEERIDAIKRETAAIAALQAKREQVAAATAAARNRVINQRRDAEALRLQLSYLSPAMIEERRVVGADLTAHLEVLDRFRQIEALLEIELAGIEAEIATRRTRIDAATLSAVAVTEAALRRCLADRRDRLK
jgi:hypothetical protein